MRDAQAAYDAAEPEEPPTCAAIHDGITLRALQSELEDRSVALYVASSRAHMFSVAVQRGHDVGDGDAATLAQAISLAVADYDRQVSRG